MAGGLLTLRNFLDTKKPQDLLRPGFRSFGLDLLENIGPNHTQKPALRFRDAVREPLRDGSRGDLTEFGGASIAAEPRDHLFGLNIYLFLNGHLEPQVLSTPEYRTLNQKESSTLNYQMFRILNMKLLSERLKFIYEQRPDLEGDRGQTGLTKASGASKSVVNQWLNDRIKSIDIKYALAIEQNLGVSHIWLMTGDGDPFVQRDPLAGLPPGSFRRVEAVEEDDPRLTRIEKVRLKVQAGITGFQTEPEPYEGDTYSVPTSWMISEGLRKESLISIVVRGDSMESGLHDGDTIVVNTADKRIVSGSVYVVNYEGEAVVKRMLRDAGQWWLTSDNADQKKYHRQLCKGAECIVIGKVVRKESKYI